MIPRLRISQRQISAGSAGYMYSVDNRHWLSNNKVPDATQDYTQSIVGFHNQKGKIAIKKEQNHSLCPSNDAFTPALKL